MICENEKNDYEFFTYACEGLCKQMVGASDLLPACECLKKVRGTRVLHPQDLGHEGKGMKMMKYFFTCNRNSRLILCIENGYIVVYLINLIYVYVTLKTTWTVY